MGKKQSKRTKKFQASGGVKKRIENGGTITKHGKLRKSRSAMKKESSAGMKDKTSQAASTTTSSKKEHHSDDFITGSDNAIGKLDLDTFFDKLSDHIDETILQNDEGEEEDEIMSDDNNDAESDDNDTDADDDDDDSTEDIAAVEAKMKQQLEKMEQSDPDFHKFLKENEKSLLEFGDDDDSYDGGDTVDNCHDDDMHDDDDDEDGDDDIMKKGKEATDSSSSSSIVLTSKLLEQLSDTAFGLTSSNNNTQSGTSTQIKALKSILVAYNCACHLSDPVTTNDGNSTTKQQQVKNNNKYTIESSKVFDDLMVLCLQYSGTTFRLLLIPVDNDEDNDNDNDAAVEDKTTTTTTTIASEKPIKPNSIEKSIHYSNIKPLIVMFYNSTIHLLSVGSKDPQLLSYVLRSLSISIPLLSPFPRTAEQLLKALVSLWCTSAVASSSSSQRNDDTDDIDDDDDEEEEQNNDSKKKNVNIKKNTKGKNDNKSKSTTTVEEDYQQVRLNAFFRIRQLALSQPYPFLDSILKKVYLAYAKRSKFSNTSGGGSNAAIGTNSQLSIQIFLCNCIVELYSIDYHCAYQHAFVYIRQLALLLRTAIQKKTVEDIQNVYCYQYFECCTVWTKLLCSTTSSALNSASNDADSELMKSLVYPLVEILYGIVRFTPQPIKYIPSRFYIIRLLQQLASCTTTFVPTSSLLLDCFDYKELYMSTKKHSTKQNQKTSGTTSGSVGAGGSSSSTKGLLHIQSLIRLPGKGDYLRYYEQIEPCMKEIFVLLQREIELYKYSAGFPEFAIRIQVRVKQYLKAISSSSGGTGGKNKNSSNNSRYRVYAKGLLDSIETYTKQALLRRSTLQESPKDVVRLECLLRPNEKIMMERHESLLHAEQQQYIDLYQLSTTGTIPTTPKSSSASKMKTTNTDKDAKKTSQLNDPKKRLAQKQNRRNDNITDDESDDEDTSMNDVEEDNDKQSAKKSIVNKNKQKNMVTKNNKNKKTKEQHLLREEDLMNVSDHVKEGIEWSSDDSDNDDNDE